jgi:tRNA(adenine34) deaminase
MLQRLLAVCVPALPLAPTALARDLHADPRWYDAALRMKLLAESWGDQPYGAVIVVDGVVAGEGPSRVVLNRDPDAHAEREAIRDAQRRLGTQQLPGAVLYSTSRPCSLCQVAAAQAGVRRMYHGPGLAEVKGAESRHDHRHPLRAT